ncbi:hypothetical protein ES707_05043 [subsurface metagenome]
MPNPQRMSRGDREAPLDRLIFHIVNFPNFASIDGPSDDFWCRTAADGLKRLGNVVLADPPWRIRLQAMVEIDKAIERLNRSGGYRITHVAELTREDGRAFTAGEKAWCRISTCFCRSRAGHGRRPS